MPLPQPPSPPLRVLVTLQPAWSHLNTVVPLALELQRHGHDVRIATSASMTTAVRGRGLSAVPAGLDWDASRVDDYFPGFLGARGTSQARQLVSLAGRGMVEDLLDLADGWRPDVVLRDASEFGGMLVGALLDVPVVVVGIGLRPPMEWLEKTFAPRLTALRSRYELSPSPERLDVTGDLWLSSYPSSFAVAEPEAMDEHHVSPVVADTSEGDILPEWLDSTGSNAVYVSLGTVFNQNVELLVNIIHTLSAEGIEIVATTGKNIAPAALGKLPSNVRVASYIPQSMIAPHVGAVVSHGGFNTMMGALAAGLPVCCVPLASDHPANASRCVELGLGRSVTTFTPPWGYPAAKPADVTPRAVVDAVLPLLQDDSYSARARAMRDEIQATPGPADAVRRIEDLVRAR